MLKGLLVMAEAAPSTAAALTDAQITEVSTSLTSTVTSMMDTFIDLLPIIALTTGAIFAVRFIKGRFRKVERQG